MNSPLLNNLSPEVAAFVGVMFFAFVAITAITWFIFPFLVVSRLNRMIKLLDLQLRFSGQDTDTAKDKHVKIHGIN